MDTPAYLDDVHLQIRDLNYRKNNYINEFESIYNSFNYMQKHDLSNVPMVNKEHSFLGTISMKEIAKDLITGDFENLNTSYNNILDVLEAKEILRFNNEIKGKILLAAFRSTTFIDTVKLTSDDILVIGDRHSIIEFAVKSGVKLIILTGNNIHTMYLPGILNVIFIMFPKIFKTIHTHSMCGNKLYRFFISSNHHHLINFMYYN